MGKRGNIYDLLHEIRERQGMFVEDYSLDHLKSMLHGYEACLWSHDLEEEVPGRPFHTSSFSEWLHETKGWPTSCGFAHAIEHETPDAKTAFLLFFTLLDQYKES